MRRSGAGAPCGLLQIPAFRFHRFAWPFETAGPSVDIAGKRRVGKDKSNTPPPPSRPHEKWDEPRSAGAKRFPSLILGFRHQRWLSAAPIEVSRCTQEKVAADRSFDFRKRDDVQDKVQDYKENRSITF
ncbi:hypothetical protein DAPPUDRAFT_237331 [Daphnia pulex]|uniref:Uncharacterized protein n=1 Tax=Daphnia pulex TaxID=6669 RepID=E9G3N2_DAPPU|nr:hypothetical protein DAPPUDRAFT_237331 [Daphnia pulex]|eukprot:EFX85797.1 hypothetical protein DAPPUDRAFT_237331 [Daphnia pulex]